MSFEAVEFLGSCGEPNTKAIVVFLVGPVDGMQGVRS